MDGNRRQIFNSNLCESGCHYQVAPTSLEILVSTALLNQVVLCSLTLSCYVMIQSHRESLDSLSEQDTPPRNAVISSGNLTISNSSKHLKNIIFQY